jgi:hypothetical protein
VWLDRRALFCYRLHKLRRYYCQQHLIPRVLRQNEFVK